MKLIRKTITAHISKVNTDVIEEWQRQVVDDVKTLLEPYRKNLDVVADTPHHYELWTNLGYRTRSFHVKRSRGIAFASIVIFKKHVAFYFYPLAISPDMENVMGESLKGLRTGQYTFHLKESNAAIRSDITALAEAGWAFYKTNRLVR